MEEKEDEEDSLNSNAAFNSNPTGNTNHKKNHNNLAAIRNPLAMT